MEIDALIAARVRDLRKARNMTMVELAELLEVSQPAISQWESGVTSPHRETLLELSKIFRTPVGVIMGESDEAPANAIPGPPSNGVNTMPTDVPVFGIAVGGSSGDFRFNGQVVDYVRRPPGIAPAHVRYPSAPWRIGSLNIVILLPEALKTQLSLFGDPAPAAPSRSTARNARIR